MTNGNNNEGLMPVMTSLAGAIGVLLVYWFHLFLMEFPITDDTGVSVTIFVSAFVAQYIPLKTAESKYRLEEKNHR
jgi:hypothetical protein